LLAETIQRRLTLAKWIRARGIMIARDCAGVAGTCDPVAGGNRDSWWKMPGDQKPGYSQCR